ncbi:DUF3823 domain-containing protein [Paraflavisolibacter sp. H34]|uniref:DUF3823 domain-containing protein n=1 Tax=Huijunlia imazamoxiresistens TaxID=3127457 RepID=UPI00301A1D36
MKLNLKAIAFVLAVAAAGSCTKIDNYEAPTETLRGNIIDAGTGKPVQSEVSGDNGAGTRIKLLELSWSETPTPLYLACKQDGTYNNTKVFAGKYKVSAEGAFVPLVQGTTVDGSKTLEIRGGTTTLDFSVEPFLRVEWVGEPVLNSNGTISANVKVTRGTANPAFQQNITDLYLYVNSTPYVGNNNFDNRYSQRLAYSGTAGNAIVGQTVTLTTIGGVLPKSRDYYVRVGSRIDYGLKQFNYNEPKVVTVP